MQPVALDTECALIGRGLKAPPMVCTSIADEKGSYLFHHSDSFEVVLAVLQSDRLIVGANIAFDMGVIAAKWPQLLPLIFEAYRQNRVTDVIIREKLQHIAIGYYRGYYRKDKWIHLGYSLADIAKRRLGRDLDKDTYRLKYGTLIDVPCEQWEQGARDYAIDDAVTALDVYYHQQDDGCEYLLDEYRQARAAWWMHLMSSWGLRTDSAAVDALNDRYREQYNKAADHLLSCGLLRTEASRVTAEIERRVVEAYKGNPPRTPSGKPKKGAVQLKHAGLHNLLALNTFTRETKRDILEFPGVESLITEGLVSVRDVRNVDAARQLMIDECRAAGVEVPLTDGGNVKLDKDVCKYTICHPDLTAYAEYSGLSTKLSNFIPLLYMGVTHPIQAFFETLLATGRTSSSPNVQNLPRNGGVRECFVPRQGYVYAAADYSSFELRTLAQACIDLFGFSKLAEALNSGFDPHLEIARRLLGITYDDAAARLKAGDSEVDDARQVGKVANFGFPGGLGVDTFVLYARKGYGVEITRELAADLKKYWLEAWPEMRMYFDHVSKLVNGEGGLTQLRSGRVRGDVSFCEACNSYFQGLAADGAKRAGFLIAYACYVDENSPLYGCRLVNFIHDEFIVECPDDWRAHDVATELARLMVVGAVFYVPDVPPIAEPCLMRRWSKKAKPVFKDGRLIPWDLAP